MDFITKSKTKIAPLETGLYQGTLTGITHVGTQHSEKFGDKDQVIWTFEIADEFLEDGDGNQMPRFLSKRYSNVVSEKSNLEKDIISWRGTGITKEERPKGFSHASMLGKFALLQVLKKEKDNGDAVNVINTIIKPGAKDKPPKGVTPSWIYSVLSGEDFPEAMPDWIKTVCQESAEWKARHPKEGGANE
jgi:hypothetical protein